VRGDVVDVEPRRHRHLGLVQLAEDVPAAVRPRRQGVGDGGEVLRDDNVVVDARPTLIDTAGDGLQTSCVSVESDEAP